ncbi:MAG TPA: lysozyme inhibitor LprI family protein [Terracidiphilus sp.]|nr:lysozyme inhibitor LprI family protein [Terracidiphilus sp.]
MTSKRAFSTALSIAIPMLIAASFFQPSATASQQPSYTAQASPASQTDAAPAQDQPVPIIIQNPIPAAQLAFLTSFDGHPAKELLKDKRFKDLLKNEIPHTEYHYGSDMPLDGALKEVLDGSPRPVEIRDGRYLLASGAQGPYLSGRGFVWIDLQQGIFLGGFYFHPTNGEPTPTLTIFSRQLDQDELALSQLPPDFSADLSQWSLVEHVPQISPSYFIPANGKKYVLLHDEAYCAGPPDAAAPTADACAHLEEQAADADMNAAYFMHETHNAANATAWMLGPDQVAWISLRERTCGIGLACRVSFTRQRTGQLIGRPMPPPHAPAPRRGR